jgi:hypothetical protein
MFIVSDPVPGPDQYKVEAVVFTVDVKDDTTTTIIPFPRHKCDLLPT